MPTLTGEPPDDADGLPTELAALETAARAAIDAASAAGRWSAGARRRALAVLDAVASAVIVAKGKVVTAERDEGTWALKGDRDLAAFLGRVSHQGRGAGFAVAGQAATLAAMPRVADALVDGPVTPTHVQEITRATAASPALATELATPEGQARLVELSRRLDGQRFGRRLKQLAATLDPASRQREHDEQRANRYLNISHGPGGTEFKGRLDSVAGHVFVKALDALDPRPAKDDDRSRGMRRADALAAMAERTLGDKQTTPGSTAPVQALIAFSEETWAALRATQEGRAGATSKGPARGSAADVVARLRGVAPVTDEDGHAWPASEIARVLCDCTLTRVVVGAQGQPLDLGRDQRLFTRAQWLAIYASGQTTCAVDGCGMPLRFTELHHMAWWDRDSGRTDLANCAPECSFHHGEVHRLGLRVSRRADGAYEHRHPDGRLYGGAPPETRPLRGGPAGSEPPGNGPPGMQLLWDAGRARPAGPR